MRHTNKLISQTSPYLLQHAHNPVQWYPWGEEALQKAVAENKPILVSIGYSACHWCHVMERESFEDEETAALMNQWFINIKIDREERPDLDHIYMDAVQTITGSGGWPLNVFLTPDRKPFYGGTYFPPKPFHNRPSWKDVLSGIHTAYTQKKHEIDAQAENLTAHLIQANAFGQSIPSSHETDTLFTDDTLQTIADNLLSNADTEQGGFGNAPKFPQTIAIQYLLRHYHLTGHDAAVQHALLSLNKMMQGGIYDHIGGGFSRYSTDTRWQVPHFEKMLYDNALLLSVLCEAYQLTQHPSYADVIKQTIHFLQTELMHPQGGFYSALDADSEGIEGKYYVWSKQEIEQLLGEEAELFCSVYDISEEGNWEETNIIWLPETIQAHASRLNIEESALKLRLNHCGQILYQARSARIRPGLDDKILLGWNALCITALCKAYAALGEEQYLQLATTTMQFIETNFKAADGGFHHTFKDDKANIPAFLDDYAYLIQAYIHLQEISGNTHYLEMAEQLTEYVINNFQEESGVLCYYTHQSQSDLIMRKKEVYDSATPSGNSIMVQNLHYLSIILNDKQHWGQLAIQMLSTLGKIVVKYPVSFAAWAISFQTITKGLYEIVVVGKNNHALTKEILALYLPLKIFQTSQNANQAYPLLHQKHPVECKTSIYLCKNYHCEMSVFDVKGLISLLKK